MYLIKVLCEDYAAVFCSILSRLLQNLKNSMCPFSLMTGFVVQGQIQEKHLHVNHIHHQSPLYNALAIKMTSRVGYQKPVPF